MSVSIPTSEPSRIIAGDTAKWKRAFAEHPASAGWALTYTLSGPSKLGVSGVAEGDAFVCTVTAAQSAELAPGWYGLHGRASKDGESYTVFTGTLEVVAAVPAVGADGRSHVKRVLDALEAVIEGRASTDQQAYSIGNRSLTRMSPQELLDWRDKYRREYQTELAAERRKRGKSGGGVMKMRFG